MRPWDQGLKKCVSSETEQVALASLDLLILHITLKTNSTCKAVNAVKKKPQKKLFSQTWQHKFEILFFIEIKKFSGQNLGSFLKKQWEFTGAGAFLPSAGLFHMFY